MDVDNLRYLQYLLDYLFALYQVAHKASTLFLHSTLSQAATLTSFHVFYPITCLAFSTGLFYVAFDLSRFLFPSGAHVMIWLRNSHCWYLWWESDRCISISFSAPHYPSFFILAFSSMTSFLTCSYRRIFDILHRHLVWKTFSFLSYSLVMFQVVVLYIKTAFLKC